MHKLNTNLLHKSFIYCVASRKAAGNNKCAKKNAQKEEQKKKKNEQCNSVKIG